MIISLSINWSTVWLMTGLGIGTVFVILIVLFFVLSIFSKVTRKTRDKVLTGVEAVKNVVEKEEIAENLPITEGVDRLMAVLKRCGYKIAILSGGFTYFGEYLQRRYGIDYMYANELEVDDDGKLTGRYLGEVVDGHRKAELLKLIAQVEKVNLAQTIAVGDGANDLPMISQAGLGIAFHAKPRVVANARQSINTIGIDGVLYFLGFKDSYLGEDGN